MNFHIIHISLYIPTKYVIKAFECVQENSQNFIPGTSKALLTQSK